MATLKPTFSVCLKDKCANLQLTDTTGTGTDKWEDSVSGSDINTGEIIITFPSGSTQTEDITSQIPDTVSGDFTYNDISLDNKEDGIHSIKYKLTNSDLDPSEVYSREEDILFTCNVECKQDSMVGKIPEKIREGCGHGSFIESAMLGEALIEALKSSAACYKTTNISSILSRLDRIHKLNDCNCD